jgi:zinc/manganese transport system substrate-binding protein
MKRLMTFLTFALLVLGGSSPALAKLKVVSTIPDFAAIAVEVGGSCVSVESLVKPTQDPHFVDAKPSLMVVLNKADLLLVTGMELEAGWLPPLLTGSRNGDIQRGSSGYLDLSTAIPPMEVQAPDRAKGDIHPGGNPHYWTDPRNGARIAKAIAAKLIELHPNHACDVRSRLHSFLNRLEDRMDDWQRRLAPHKGTKVVVYHKSWVYFLDWAGFVRAGALEPKPGIPPKPSHVAQLIKKVKNQRVKYVIQESFYPTNLSKVFASKSGAKLKVLPTMVGARGTSTYFDVIEKLVTELTN